MTSALNIGVFQLFYALGADYRIANLIAIPITKIAAYLVNKFFVFRSHCPNKRALFDEIIRFVFSRGFTTLIDYFGLILWTDILHLGPRIGKIVVALVVILLNYLFGKRHVFKTPPQKPTDPSAEESASAEEGVPRC